VRVIARSLVGLRKYFLRRGEFFRVLSLLRATLTSRWLLKRCMIESFNLPEAQEPFVDAD
jgi:hypothetical protein